MLLENLRVQQTLAKQLEESLTKENLRLQSNLDFSTKQVQDLLSKVRELEAQNHIIRGTVDTLKSPI